jgi:hypothetical protein
MPDRRFKLRLLKKACRCYHAFNAHHYEENTARLDASVFLSRMRLQELSTGKAEVVALEPSFSILSHPFHAFRDLIIDGLYF